MTLRPYQQRDILRIRSEYRQGKRHVLYVGPTGSGKTVLFAHAARKAVEQNRRVLIVVHRQELVDQTVEALEAEGITCGIIAAGYAENSSALVQVAMVFTLANRLEQLVGVELIVVDEAQHILATTWLAILEAAPHAHLLGVTATPERLDGKGLDAAFDVLVIGPSVKELIAKEYLSRFVVYAPASPVNLKHLRSVAGDYALGQLAERMNTDIVTADAIAEYKKHLIGQSALAFCVNIKHSRATARAFCQAGINAVHLDGDTPTQVRKDIIARLATEALVVCNCGIISEGLNVPCVGGVILLRPTKSLGLYLQQIGRALRPAPGKTRAVILDHAGNVFTHGFPDLEHAWSLQGRKKKRGQAPIKRCEECGALIPASVGVCPECGAVQPISEKSSKQKVSRPLVELDDKNAHEYWLATASFRSVTKWAGTNADRLRQVARARGYKAGWVWWRLQDAEKNMGNSLHG
jgi:DNA repair protein RadD